MKKIFKLSLLLLTLLIGASQSAWASNMGYFAKATAKVSTKSNGHGAIYMGPAVTFAGSDKIQNAAGEDATIGALPFTYDDYGCPNGVKEEYTLETEMPKWLTANQSAIVARDVQLMGVGTAQPVWAVYQAVPAPGYYLKGWSTQDNDASLGKQNPFAYSVQSQAMASAAAVNEVMVYMNGQKVPLGYYVAEGNSNRYLYANKTTVTISGEEQTVYQCYPTADGYSLFDMTGSGTYLYIPQRDNVNQRFYVINDDGNRVDIRDLDGKYLTFPKDDQGNAISDASYMIYKNPYYASNPSQPEFLVHRYDPTALATCAATYTYGSDAFWYCVQQALMNYSPTGEPLLVSFQRATYTKEGQEIPASAVVATTQDGETKYNAIQFLPDVASIPSIPTIYATFAPVQINGCTGGNIVSWTDADETAGSKSFDVTFSTSYASSMADFGAVTFDKQPTAGGTYSATIANFDAETGVVTVSVTFTGSGLAGGEYKSSMTLQSLGGESKMATLVNVRIGAEANKAVAIGDNRYDDLASALTAANAGDVLVLLTDITANPALAKNITLNLDGWTLTGNVAVSDNVILKNGTVGGNVTVTAAGNLTVDGTTINGTLTNAGTATLRRGTFNGNTNPSVVNSGTLTLEKGAEIMGDNNVGVYMAAGQGTVNGARFHGPYPIQLAEGSNGVFNAAYFTQEFPEVASLGLTHYDITVGTAYEAGYTHLYATSPATAKAAGAPVCKIGQTGYTSLEDALLYAQNNPSEQVTIIMLNDYTLPAGWYTLPANANLLIPYTDSQTSIMGASPKKLATNNDPYVTPFAFRTLTFADGVHMTVAGSIEASCRQFIGGQAAQGNAVPSGGYGWLKLEEGSEITMGNGSHLYAWGFVTGQGEIDVRRGGTVHEDFQVYDWPGGNDATSMLITSIGSGHGAFPINQYFMQNVESPVTFHPGARMYCSFGATAAGIQVAADNIQIVGIEGDIAMFLMDPNADADNTWVRKRYDAANDIQVWEINSGANLGSMVIDVPAFKLAAQMGFTQLAGIEGFDSRNFILPITNNLKIHLLTGYMGITQNTELLPGAEIEVNKESTVEIVESTDASSGFLYLIDNEDWSNTYACKKPAQQILYSPSFGGAPNIRNISSKDDLPDATINVHGTLQVSGMLMTTPGGANVFSTNEDAGTVYFPQNLDFMYDMGSGMQRHQYPVAAIPNQVFDAQGEGSGFPIPAWNAKDKQTENMIARTAQLRNGIGTPAQSGGATTNMSSFAQLMTDPENWAGPYDGDNFTLAGESFCYVRDRWTKMTQYDDQFAYNNYDEWYIKPSEYVAIATTANDPAGDYSDAGTTTQPLLNADHTYSDAAGQGRLFIWVASPSNGAPGQWWEVTLEDNLYKGMNGTYYFYDEADEVWTEATYSITFLNYDGSPVLDNNGDPTVYPLHYGDRIQFLGTNPTRPENVDYTYTFTGWSPAINKDTKVTGNATYMATFEATQRKYTIIFLNENGTEIERQFLTRDEVPACENTPSKTGYYLQWSPAIGAVTGDQEYTATFTPEKPTAFTITFKNYDGTVLQTGEVNVGETPSCATPAKPATSEYTYTFAGWNPAVEPVSQEMTYTAKFNEVGVTYPVRFFQPDGTTQIGTTQNLTYGAAPAIPDYNQPATQQYTYTTTWTPQVAAVTGAQDYTAVLVPTTNKYTVTINATGCIVEGAGAFDYGTAVTLKLGAALDGYENPTWSDGTTADKSFTLTDNVTYTAIASVKQDKKIDLTTTANIDLTEDTRVAAFNVVAGPDASGNLTGAQYIDLTGSGKATYQYNFNAAAFKWYAFGVPFKCDAQTAKAANGSTLRNTHEYDIVEYDGAIRAAQGKVDACWKYVSGTLYPGKLYMIIFNRNQTSVTFTGKDNGTYDYSASASVTAYGTSGEDAGWNGIANPALYHAALALTGATYGQVYNPATEAYEQVTLSATSLPIGKPVFVQTAATGAVTAAATAAAPVAARQSAAAQADTYVLHLADDKAVLVTDPMAYDEYEIGHDLAKFAVSTKVAQVWVNRYDTKLCVNHAAEEWGETTFPLGIYAPKAGTYTLTLDNDANTNVYLMENGVPVCNLRNGACTRTLAAGTTTDYAISIKPITSIVTDLEEQQTTEGAEKVIINGVLYILRGGNTYDAMGKLIK